MRSRLSPDVLVMLRPKRTFAELSRLPERGGRWLGWRRPLLVVSILSTCVAMLARGHFAVLLAASVATYWVFVPLVQIAGLAAVGRRWPGARTIDRYFTGHGPWLLWLTAFTAYSTFRGTVDPPGVFRFWIAMAAMVLVWSCWIDYRFFGSLRRLALHRAVSWTLFAAIFAGSWIWNEIAWGLGL